MQHDLIVVGAGIAGLACARRAVEAGLRTLVVEKARGVGGRCATRRVDGQAVDHGLTFLHGADPEFLAAIDAVDAGAIDGWPIRVRGTGTPCQPAAFAPGEHRRAFAEGVSSFPKHLARGLEIRLDLELTEVDDRESPPVLRFSGGGTLVAPRLALTLPCEQTRRILSGLSNGDPEFAAAARLLDMSATRPSLTVLAGYPMDTPWPDWDIWYPEDSRLLQVLANDSAKRRGPKWRVLVLQAHARWSTGQLDTDPEIWAGLMMEEAARLLGPWALAPGWRQAHRWRYARSERDGELSSPMVLTLPDGSQIGMAGERFAQGGGAQGAFESGRRLALRFAAIGAA